MRSEPSTSEIVAALAPFGVQVGERLAQQVRVYLRTLLFWNQKVNLTAITEPGEVLRRHFGESMFGAEWLARTDGVLADVGSGAGFPGLALKLVCPALRVKLIEPTTKKAVFLSEVVRALGLSGVEVVRARTEELADMKADAITARAVGDLAGVLGWSGKALPDGGQVLLWLGADDAKRAASIPGWEWAGPVAIPESSSRVLLSGRKCGRQP